MELQAHPRGSGNILRHCPVYDRSSPKYAVSEELLTLAEDKSTEANLLSELSQNALQWQTLPKYKNGVS